MPSQPEASGSLALRPLGSTGLHVTPICIGAAPLGNMPEDFAYEVSEERALATVRAVLAGPSTSWIRQLPTATVRASDASAAS